MTERGIATSIDEGGLPPEGLAGTLLRAAREAAGMSVDAVAQQLKLAPRQVKALEEGDYTHLPGRTFVRGFVRNYARLVRLDPESVLGALPAGASVPALEAPMLQQTAQTMGELPTTDRSKAGWTRWAIPMTLAAVVAAAAAYEWLQPPGESRTAPGRDPAADVEAPPPAAVRLDAPGTALQNPFAPGAAEPSPATRPSASSTPATASSPVSTSAVTAVSSDATVADQPLILAYRDYSWTEVRDRRGRVLLSGMNPGGTAQTLSGAPPLELVIGNAADVSVRYRGQTVDLVPYTRQNVARITLP